MFGKFMSNNRLCNVAQMEAIGIYVRELEDSNAKKYVTLEL